MLLRLFLVGAFFVSFWQSLSPPDAEEICSGSAPPAHPVCSSRLYCHGELLRRVQEAELFPDSKTFVDMPCRLDETSTLQAWKKEIPKENATRSEIRDFVQKYFHPAGSDTEPVTPKDWPSEPPLLERFQSPELRGFLGSLHGKWLGLLRRFKTEMTCSSRLDVPNPFVVAGGRFLESYYWDTYWILKGLLISGMPDTAQGVIENFFFTLREHGVIPNGQRLYYLNRSQPPLLTRMVADYVQTLPEEEDRQTFLRRSLPYLEQELEWWKEQRSVDPESLPRNSPAPDHRSFQLNLYNVTADAPRPESFSEDLETCVQHLRKHGETPERASFIHSALSSGAESGWDFSSRWMVHPEHLESLRTHRILPVDLNVLIHWTQVTLKDFFTSLGEERKAAEYADLAETRRSEIREHLWDPEEKRWRDLWLKTSSTDGSETRKAPEETRLYLSDLLPLLSGGHLSPEAARENPETVVPELRALVQKYESILEQPFGIASSNVRRSEQQWDGVNGWAPIQQFLLEAFLEYPEETRLPELAWIQSRKIFQNMYCGWLETRDGSGGLEDGLMYEKYNVSSLGAPGGGGEYPVQTGFGWSNGVAFWILEKFSDRERDLLPSTCGRGGRL